MALGPLNQVHISVADVDRSVTFYRDVLGIPLLFQVPGQPMAFFQSGDVRLYLGVPERAEFTSHAVLYFDVPEIEAEYKRLSGLGVDIEPPHLVHRDDAGELWMASFQDPDGHRLQLSETRPR